jgi:predicted nuclease of predicted toxin-antitoxin system
MGISPSTIAFLQGLGHDSVHLHAQGLGRLHDAGVLAKALQEGRILLTHDLGFGELMAASNAQLPSVIVFRLRNMRPERVNLYLQDIINEHRASLEQGAIVSVNEGQIRVRLLPHRRE